VACCWNADNGALLFGSLAGPADPCARCLLPSRHRRALQALSPKKTVTGVVGALVLGSLTAVLLAAIDRRKGGGLLPLVLLPLPLPGRQWTLWEVWWLGVAMAVLAQAGDLLESWAKRAAQVKVSQHVRGRIPS
jgi:CDP-diglyceride synthetase